jgi:YesN/AraC family two-component response regulator
MNKQSIIVIADKNAHQLYRSLHVGNRNVVILDPGGFTDHIKHYDPDVVLLDCGFDASRGIEMLSKIKVHWQGVPIVFLTDESSEDIVIKAYRIGVREYFKKPMNIFEIENTVEILLEIKKTAGEKRASLSVRKNASADGMVDLLNSITTDTPENLLKSIHYMEEHLSEAYYLEKLAHQANLSKYHFCRTFKKFIGTSPVKFITILRIKKAKELLRTKKLAVYSVAGKVGYNDLSNFERQFKKITGMTPTCYRGSLKNDRSFDPVNVHLLSNEKQ